MNDTHPEISAKVQDLMMQKSGEQRLIMGCSMYDTAKQIVRSSIYNTHPGVTKEQMRKEIFIRFYGQEFSQPDRDRILSVLTSL